MGNKKMVLDFEITLDFEVVGIVSSLLSYELAWLLNNRLYFDFIKAKDWHIDIPGSQKIGYFECFSYKVEHEWCELYLYKNFDSNDYLIPELRKFEYLLKIEGAHFTEYSRELIKRLKNINELKFVKSFHPDELHSGINLLTDDKNLQQDEDYSDGRTGLF